MGTALVVDDSLTDTQILASCLQQEGISVLIAQTGEEAIIKVAEQRPDVIVMDVVLPGCSGFEVCRELKAKADTSDIPVIICSNKGTEMDRFWGMKQGADAYLVKPIDQAEFVKTVKRMIRN